MGLRLYKAAHDSTMEELGGSSELTCCCSASAEQSSGQVQEAAAAAALEALEGGMMPLGDMRS